jgi:hypothetical protein
MTTIPPSPFLSSTVETLSPVSTVAEAAASLPPSSDAAASPPPDEGETCHIHEIFHFARQLAVVDEVIRDEPPARQAEIDCYALAAVAREIDAWQAEREPLPIFLTMAV